MNAEPPKEIWERKKLGLELRQKYELFFLSLAFTLTGLSVQTARPTEVYWRVFAEIGGWVCLLAAGLIGLWRVSTLWRREVGVAEYIESQYGAGDSKAYREALNNLEALIRRLGRVQYGFFIGGLVLVGISRAVWLLTK